MVFVGWILGFWMSADFSREGVWVGSAVEFGGRPNMGLNVQSVKIFCLLLGR